jgi:hypothetical protein
VEGLGQGERLQALPVTSSLVAEHSECKCFDPMTAKFDNSLTYITVDLPKVEVFGTAREALSIVDERKDSAGIPSDN